MSTVNRTNGGVVNSLELFSIRCFAALAHYLKFYEAAEEMHISPSAFSRQIQLLEMHLGARLFTRGRRSCALTPAGTELLPYAESIISELDRADTLINLHSRGAAERLTIFTDCLSDRRLSGFLSRFELEFPGIPLEICEMDGDQALLSLYGKAAPSVAIIYSAMEASYGDFDCFPLFPVELVLLLSLEHPLAAHDAATIPMLRGELLQLRQKPTSTLYELIVRLCENAGFSPEFSPYELWYSTTPQAILETNAVSIMYRGVAERVCTPYMKIITLKDVPLWSIRILKSKTAAAAADTFCEFARGAQTAS